MAGDRKGKVKVVEKTKKKRTREERKWDRAIAAADASDQPQRSIRIRGSQAEGQGEPEYTPPLHRSGRTCGSETAQPSPPALSGPRTRGGAT